MGRRGTAGAVMKANAGVRRKVTIPGPSRRWEDDPVSVAARAKALDALDRLDRAHQGRSPTDAMPDSSRTALRDLGEAMIELCPLAWPVLPNGGGRPIGAAS